MSGRSSSLTFPIEAHRAQHVIDALNAGDASVFDECIGDTYLMTGSRNNFLEGCVKRLVLQFRQGGLQHLTSSIDASGTPQSGWFVAALHHEALSAAIVGMEELLASVQRDLARTAQALGGMQMSAEDADLLSHPPTSVSAAIERSDECRAINEGDDIATLFSFLQAHLAVLRFAKSKARSAIYAALLY